jgi:hypothetical protein
VEPALFWNWFRKEERRFRGLKLPGDEALLDLFEAELHRVAPGLGFLFSFEPDEQGRFEVVLTTHGDPAKQPLVDALVAAAPAIEGWVVVRLQPPKGFDFTYRADGVELDPGALRFDPLERPGDDALGLLVVAPATPGLSLAGLRTAVHRILSTALGDEAFGEIAHVQVAFDDPPSDQLIPITDLPGFLAWRAGRSGT